MFHVDISGQIHPYGTLVFMHEGDCLFRCALVSPWLLRSLPGSWLRLRPFYTVPVPASHYLDDWLIQAASRSQVLIALDAVLQLCHSLWNVVNWEKSHLLPAAADDISWRSSGLAVFQGFACQEESREASLNRRHIPLLRRAASVMLARALGSPVIADSLGSRRSTQDALSSTAPASILGSLRPISSGAVELGLPTRPRVVVGSVSSRKGVSLSQVSPNLDFWSDASDVGWGAHVGDNVVSGCWSPQEADLSINARELLAVERGLHHFAPQLVDSTVAVYADNSTAVAYLRNQGGTQSPLLNSIAQRILRWAESLPLVLAPQFMMGKNNVLADALSRPNQILGSEWTLKTEVFLDLRKRWPVMINLFATSSNHQCSLYFSPFHDLNALGTDALLQNWDGYQGFAFPP